VSEKLYFMHLSPTLPCWWWVGIMKGGWP